MKVLKYILVCFLCIFVPIGVFYFVNNVYLENDINVFGFPINIYGVEISGLTKTQAEEKIDKKLQSKKDGLSLNLKYQNKTWNFFENDFVVKSNVHTILDEMYKYNNRIALLKKAETAKKIKKMGFEDKVAINYVFVGMDEKLDEIIREIETPFKNADVFYNSKLNNLNFVKEEHGIKVDKDKLYSKIYNNLQTNNEITIEIPTTDISPEIFENDLKEKIKKQASFSTSYISSSKERKNNIKIATEKLNGYRINPNEVFSFNEAVGKRLSENGYKEANIIKDGSFVKGVGGGVCQVSTTLYNALILSNIEITEVHKHTLPVSYVKPALDAMVSWGTADLKFKNNTSYPIFIISNCNGSKLTFGIYGDTNPEGFKLQTRSEITKVIPYEKDEIIPDVYGKYADKIMFKGEFLRVKYGKDGYEANSYLDFYKNNKLIKSKMIRTCEYDPQNGVLYEGVDTIPEGMTLPKNNIVF